jgi:hypothetical protein
MKQQALSKVRGNDPCREAMKRFPAPFFPREISKPSSVGLNSKRLLMTIRLFIAPNLSAFESTSRMRLKAAQKVKPRGTVRNHLRPRKNERIEGGEDSEKETSRNPRSPFGSGGFSLTTNLPNTTKPA